MSDTFVGVGIWLWGFIIAFFVRKRTQDSLATSLIKATTLAPLTGPGLLSVAWFFALYFRQPSALVWIMLALSLQCVIASRIGSTPQPPRPQESNSCSKWVMLPLSISLALTVLSLSLDQIRPTGGSDATAIWNYAARFLYRSGVNYPDLMPSLDVSHHMDYPLFIPSAIAAQWHLCNEESWRLVQWTHVGFTLPLACLCFELINAVRSARLAAVTSSAMILTPSLLIWSQRQYVDSHVAYALLGCVGGCGLALHSRGPSPLAPFTTGLFFGALPWLKNEGIPLSILSIALFFIIAAKDKRLALQKKFILQFSLASLFFSIALVVFKQGWPPPNDLMEKGGSTISEYISDWSRWKQVLAAYGGEFDPRIELSKNRWGFSLILTAVLFVIGGLRGSWKKNSMNMFFTCFALLSCAGWVLVYVLTPQELGWHLQTSMNRLILQLLPTLLTISVICALGPFPIRDSKSDLKP